MRSEVGGLGSAGGEDGAGRGGGLGSSGDEPDRGGESKRGMWLEGQGWARITGRTWGSEVEKGGNGRGTRLSFRVWNWVTCVLAGEGSGPVCSS